MERESAVPRRLRIALTMALVMAFGLLVAAAVLFVATPDEDEATAAGPVDVGFSQDMSVHHLQGVQMANVARERSADPTIKQLAFDIETTQLEQVGRMKGWLSLWNQLELPSGGYMAWMAPNTEHGQGHGPAANTQMPGMASQEDLTKLRSLSGPEFDTFFLQLMIRHHQGGASMMREAAQRAEVPQVRNLAQQMLNAQSSEITVMTRMVSEIGAQPPTTPN